MKKVLILCVTVIVVIIAISLSRLVDVNELLEAGSIIILALILAVETGLLFGFFLPGDTLLFAAGFFAGEGRISLAWTLLLMFVGAVLGNIMGYEIGRRTGHKVFKNDEAIFFSKDNITRAESFYKKHGGKTILIARFIPVVRTVVPPLAGMAKMNYKLFTIYSLIGGFVWVTSITLIGFWAGRVIGHYFDVDKYILPIVILAALISFGGSVLHILRDKKARQKLKTMLKQKLKHVF